MTSCGPRRDRALPVPRETGELLARWGRVWGRPGLRAEVRVEFSPRLSRSLGRCLARRGVIRLNPVLVDPGWQTLFPEVLCHEAAHVVAFALHGRRRPHGPEWRRLMVAAGFEPRVSIRVDELPVECPGLGDSERSPHPGPGLWGHRRRRGRAIPPEGNRPPVIYTHRCPVCQSVWTARRPMRRWRCSTCIDLRGRGELIISSRPARVPQ